MFLAGLGAFDASAAETAVISSPLKARSGPRGTTLFRTLAPSETGIVAENKYDDPRMWGEYFRRFLYGSLGTGVAIGDYDGDGRPDILVVSKAEGHRLFRNLGDWKFQDVTEPAGIAVSSNREWEQGVSWVDVNNDGKLDLYICRSGAPNLLYINQGNGTFKEEAAARGLAVNDDSVMAAFCDYDRDGWLDVYIVTNALYANDDAGRPDLLFHNNGDGTFTNVTAKAGIGDYAFQGHAAIWWDYDNDGWPDLYVANDYSPPDIIYHNDGNGTFSLHGNLGVPHTPNNSMGADLGDLNNDGLIDLIATDMAPMSHEREQRTLAEARAKLNQASLDPLTVIQLPRNALYLNTGTGFSLEAAELAGIAATGWTWSVRCEDLDCDGRLDLHFTNGMNREQNNVDLNRRIASANSIAEQIQVMKSSPVLAEPNLAFRNLGDLRFEDVSAAWGLDQNGVSFGAAFGDLDDDGDLDLVYTNYQSGVTVLRNDADTGHRVVLHLRGTASNRFGVGATVRIETSEGPQVRQLVLARGYMSSSEPMIHFGLGKADHIERATITWPSGRKQVLTNLAADQSYVITEPDETHASVAPPPAMRPQFTEIASYAGLSYFAKERSFDEEAIQPLLPRHFSRAGPAIAAGDLNGDGIDDICLGGTTREAPRALIADGHGDYHDSGALASFGNTAVNDGPVLIFDANGDGKSDVLITSGGVAAPAKNNVYQPRLLLNQGDGHFIRAAADALTNLPDCVGAAAAVDFDHDGKLDVFLGGRILPGQYPLSPRSVLLHNRGGSFEDVTDSLAPELAHVGLVTSALWSDVDGDSWADLLVALEWGQIKYFHNRQGQGFDDWTEKAGFASAGTGMWSSLAVGDFNGDGQPDYVAGNVGLNTPYRASRASPLVLYRGVFANGAEPLTLEGYYEGETLFPRAPRSELSAVLPQVLKRFPSNNAYAKAKLAEILGAERLAAAQRFSVTELRSGIFLSQPDHTYRFEPLPRLAQIAPLEGIVTGDFDGDGFTDIVAIQNNYSFSQAVGHFDGGLGQYSRGDGHGHFNPVSAGESGIVVPGDARALAVIDFDGDGLPDFFASRSGSPTLAWQNRGTPGTLVLEVRLHGASANPTAIGARLTLVLADGTTQIREVAAGGGVLSQNSATAYFAYPPAHLPVRLRIVWPDGVSTELPLDHPPGRLDFAQPSKSK